MDTSPAPVDAPFHTQRPSERSLAREPDKRKQSLYFPTTLLHEIQHEAARLDRSLSWVVQKGWEMSRQEIASWPPHGER